MDRPDRKKPQKKTLTSDLAGLVEHGGAEVEKGQRQEGGPLALAQPGGTQGEWGGWVGVIDIRTWIRHMCARTHIQYIRT